MYVRTKSKNTKNDKKMYSFIQCTNETRLKNSDGYI